MYLYAGYGFDAERISETDLLRLMKEHDADEYETFAEDCMKNFGSRSEEILVRNVGDRIWESNMSVAEYVAEIINEGETELVGRDGVVETCGSFVVFPPIAFAGESKRADAVRSREDFAKIIGKYLNLNELTFGNVYSGDEWSDSNWFMD